MTIKNSQQRVGIWRTAIALILFASAMLPIHASAAEPTIEFSSGGVLTLKDGGAFETSGGNPSAGLLDAGTSIQAIGDLEIVLETLEEVTVLDIQVSGGNLTVNGTGRLVASNSSGDAISVGGDLTVNSMLTGSGLQRGVTADGDITVSLGGVLLGTTSGATGTRGIYIQGNITCNSGAIYGSGNYIGIYSDSGDITANSGGLIESTTSATYPIRTETGSITANGGTIRGLSSRLEGVSTGLAQPGFPCAVIAINGGKIIGDGDNSGVGSGGELIADNGIIEGTSRRIGACGEQDVVAKNGGTITGTIVNADPGQDYGVISWDGNVLANSNGSILGSGELGVSSYPQSIEADGGSITGNGEVYGVYAAVSMNSKNGGSIKGTANREDAFVKGIYARVDITATNAAIEGQAKFAGVVANGVILAQINATVKGTASVRIDDGASVSSPSITVTGGSTVFESYLGDVVLINSQTPVNPYFNSKNMTDFNNYTWSADSGAVEATPAGLIATQPSDLSTIRALRNYAAGTSEVVVLSGTGDRHIIELPATLAVTPVTAEPPSAPDVESPPTGETGMGPVLITLWTLTAIAGAVSLSLSRKRKTK